MRKLAGVVAPQLQMDEPQVSPSRVTVKLDLSGLLHEVALVVLARGSSVGILNGFRGTHSAIQ